MSVRDLPEGRLLKEEDIEKIHSRKIYRLIRNTWRMNHELLYRTNKTVLNFLILNKTHTS